MKNNFEKIKSQTPKDIQIFIEKSFDIVDEVDFILEKQNKNRAVLASQLNKNESEISKWLSGLHNLTIKSISKIEASLGETIISTPSQEAKKYEEIFKSLQDKLKRLEIKCEEFNRENQNLKKRISGMTHAGNSNDYRHNPKNRTFTISSVRNVSREMNSLYNNSSTFMMNEWENPIDHIDTATKKNSPKPESAYLSDEYENLAI
jgi:transcriptional regulator with XRE-family HTH domain